MLVCRLFNDIRNALDHSLYEALNGCDLVQNGQERIWKSPSWVNSKSSPLYACKHCKYLTVSAMISSELTESRKH